MTEPVNDARVRAAANEIARTKCPLEDATPCRMMENCDCILTALQAVFAADFVDPLRQLKPNLMKVTIHQQGLGYRDFWAETYETLAECDERLRAAIANTEPPVGTPEHRKQFLARQAQGLASLMGVIGEDRFRIHCETSLANLKTSRDRSIADIGRVRYDLSVESYKIALAGGAAE